jgi:iron complex outermembrane recepter protein
MGNANGRIFANGMSTALLAGSILSAPVLAQDAPAAPQTAASEEVSSAEIIVTASRRSQALSTVPIAVSAITREDIERRNVTTLDELQASVPGLRLVDIGPGTQRIQLRGVSQYLGLPTVGNYIDEFSINNFAASGVPEVQLLDLARVEVLRGPQPALYGEGSMGGTIRYITADPDLNNISGTGFAEISSVNRGEVGYRAEGILNVPIIADKLGLRVAASRREIGGWIDGPLGEDVNDRRITTVRAKLLARPTESLEISLLGLYNRSEQDNTGFSVDGFNTRQTAQTPRSQEYGLGVLQASYDFGPFTLLSVSGYFKQDQRTVSDSGAFFNTLFGAPIFQAAISDSSGTLKRWSQELRITSNSKGPFRYVLGTSYTDGDTSGTATNVYTPKGVIPDDLSVTSQKSKVWAVFGNLEYDLGDWLTLEAGGRYFNNKIEANSLVTTFAPRGTRLTPFAGSARFETFNPRFAATVHAGKGIFYVSAARGFRSGGFNQAVGSPNPTFDPESLWTYEVGAKQSLLDGSLYLETAVYYQDYKDIQSTNVTALGGTAVFNSGAANGFGADFTMQAKPSKDLSVAVNVGYADVTFTTTSVDKFKGDPLDLVPKWTVSVAVDYTPPITDKLNLMAHVDISDTDKAAIILRQIGALGFPPVTPNEARTIVNTKLGIGSRSFEAYVFASNLFNEIRQVNPAFGGFVEPIFTTPRTIGVGGRFRF